MSRKSNVTRRKFLKGAAKTSAAIGAGAVAAKIGAPAIWAQSKPDTLNVGAWGGLYGEAIHGGAGESFEKKFGVKINYVRGGDSAKMTQMRAEKGHQTLDVAYWTPTSASIMARELGDVVPIAEKADLIPNMMDLAPASRDPKIWSDFGLPPWTYGWTLLYRTDRIDEAAAKAVDSWEVIFDEKYKRRIGWPNINWGNGWGLLTLAMLSNSGTIESGKPHDAGPGWTNLERLKPQVLKFYDNDGEAEQLLRSGDTWITIRSTFENSLFRQKGVPVNAWTGLKEGMCATNEAISMIRTGDKAREDLSAEYLNHALSVEAQEKFATFFFTPINPKAKLPPSVAAELLTVEEVAQMNHFDWLWMGEMLDPWTEQWNKALAG